MSTPCRLYSGELGWLSYLSNILSPPLAIKWGSKNFLLASLAEFVPHFQSCGAAPSSRSQYVIIIIIIIIYMFKYTVSQKNTVQNYFCQNFIKFQPILIIFDRKTLKRPTLCEIYLFSTSPNLRHHTTYFLFFHRCSKLLHNNESCYLQ